MAVPTKTPPTPPAPAFQNYTELPRRVPITTWFAVRAVTVASAAGSVRCAVRQAPHRPACLLERDCPLAPPPFPGRRPGVAQPLPRGSCQPDAAPVRIHPRLDGPGLAPGQRLPDQHRAVLRHRGHPEGAVQHQWPRGRPGAAVLDGERLRRGLPVQGQERLVQQHVPPAPGAAALRPDPVRGLAQRPLPALRRLHQELLRLQPQAGLPGRHA